MATILVCDDSSFMRMTIAEALQKAGHVVVGQAQDGDEAVSAYRKLKPDLVTMDILMRVPGVSAIQRIREEDPKAKIVVVSVLNEQEAEIVDAVRKGALGIVTKPIKRETLVSEVNRVLALNN